MQQWDLTGCAAASGTFVAGARPMSRRPVNITAAFSPTERRVPSPIGLSKSRRSMGLCCRRRHSGIANLDAQARCSSGAIIRSCIHQHMYAHLHERDEKEECSRWQAKGPLCQVTHKQPMASVMTSASKLDVLDGVTCVKMAARIQLLINTCAPQKHPSRACGHPCRGSPSSPLVTAGHWPCWSV